MTNAHRVIVVGAGFGGLEAVHRLAGAPVSITVVDHRNHHLFQPLLYQAATASLAPSEIAWPIRHLFRRRSDVTTLLASVESVDRHACELRLDDGSTLRYDTLVLATGARHAYFGHDDWEPFAPGLKTLEDATTIRGRILLAFEQAERQPDERKRAALMTFVIVGAGPTGVELAGAIAELARATLPAEFRRIDTREAHIVLIEDAAIVLRPDGRPVPGIAPAAKQEGVYVANVIRARLRGAPALPPFRYSHAGDLATIGKRRAVIDFGWIKLRGALAWWLWGFAHIYFLIGVRNRLSVALNWLWIYARDQRSARLITWRGGEVEGTAPFSRGDSDRS